MKREYDKDPFPAHIRMNADGSQSTQSVCEHCHNTAAYASEALKSVSLEKTGFLAGLLHDMGKYTQKFRNYIQRASNGEAVVRGSVNHTFAGVRYVLENFRQSASANKADINRCVTRDVLAYAIGAHHGAFDCLDENGRNGFEYRRDKDDIDYEEAVNNYQMYCAGADELNELFLQSADEIASVLQHVKDLAIAQHKEGNNSSQKVLQYDIGLISRLIQSAVIEGDRRDTAAFMSGGNVLNADNEKIGDIWNKELKFAESKISKLDNSTDINKARNTISNICREKAEDNNRLFQLNVPTGSGKTLSSLRFALAHAAAWNKERIIFTSPLLSILEQNAGVVRSYISDQSLILEHHSNVVQTADKSDELNSNELLVQSWESPIIITTLVQLLNTMFAGKTSNIRRYHALCNAVIVIDEVQSVPTRMLTMFDLMVTFLTEICGTTIILCSATQPNWNKADYPLPVKPMDLVPYDQNLWKVFERNRILDGGKCRTELLPEKVLELTAGTRSNLVVCNKKSESEFIYQKLSENSDIRCFHLSASMCMEHRRSTLAQLRTAMENNSDGRKIFCVATQVIEAGVDISFDCVIRLMAGLDNAVQAAGRCNRNGESQDPGKVYILNCTDENLNMLSEIDRSKKACGEVMVRYDRDPETFGNDLSSMGAVRSYYESLYRNMERGYQDDPVPGTHYSVFDLISDNPGIKGKANRENDKVHVMRQAFKVAAGAFHVFDDSSIDVIVPYGEGKAIIEALNSERAEYDYEYCRELVKKSRGYTVTLYPYQKHQLARENALILIPDLDIWYLNDGYYDLYTGVRMQRSELSFLSI